jgi:hypothetical protein
MSRFIKKDINEEEGIIKQAYHSLFKLKRPVKYLNTVSIGGSSLPSRLFTPLLSSSPILGGAIVPPQDLLYVVEGYVEEGYV